jgi:hypothetical protein
MHFVLAAMSGVATLMRVNRYRNSSTPINGKGHAIGHPAACEVVNGLSIRHGRTSRFAKTPARLARQVKEIP